MGLNLGGFLKKAASNLNPIKAVKNTGRSIGKAAKGDFKGAIKAGLGQGTGKKSGWIGGVIAKAREKVDDVREKIGTGRKFTESKLKAPDLSTRGTSSRGAYSR